jgi:ferric-dicitrate binding protein FerR (iron transport regulator)
MQSERLTMDDETPLADDPIGRLVRLVGPRPGVAAERERRVKAAVRAAWRGEVRRRSRRRALWAVGALAAAAALALTIGRAPRERLTPRPVPPVATVATVAAAVGVAGLAAGDAVSRDATLDTGEDGSVALRLAGGAAVRLDARTRLVLRSPSALELAGGALYVDSGGAGGAVEIRTAFGVARDVGTRFEVRVGAASVRLRVREGEVLLEHGGTAHAAGAGVGGEGPRRVPVRRALGLGPRRRAALRARRPDAGGDPRLGGARDRPRGAPRRSGGTGGARGGLRRHAGEPAARRGARRRAGDLRAARPRRRRDVVGGALRPLRMERSAGSGSAPAPATHGLHDQGNSGGRPKSWRKRSGCSNRSVAEPGVQVHW